MSERPPENTKSFRILNALTRRSVAEDGKVTITEFAAGDTMVPLNCELAAFADRFADPGTPPPTEPPPEEPETASTRRRP